MSSIECDDRPMRMMMGRGRRKGKWRKREEGREDKEVLKKKK